MSVGEGWPTVEIALDYTKEENQELNMLFQFETCTLDWNHQGYGKYDPIPVDHKVLKDSISKWQVGLDALGWNTLFLENHDLGRSLSRYGNDKEYWRESGKMLATMMFFLKGTPFLYQGQEIGATNPYFKSLDMYDDVDTKTKYKELVLDLKVIEHDAFLKAMEIHSRDNGRTPMHWSNAVNAGFNSGAKPWLSINENYPKVNVESELLDEDSILNYYKKLIVIRKGKLQDIILDGTYKHLEELEVSESMFVYQMAHETGSYTVVLNLGMNEIDYNPQLLLENRELVVSNYKDVINKLRPYEALVIKEK
jgi:glycosidase